jgi:transcription antitermination factor NusG
METQWYALHVRPRFEKAVARNLHGKGYEEFLPLYSRRNTWSDRTKSIELPLFPAYVFCKFNITNRLPILTTPGVNSVVGIGKSPMPVEPWELDNIRRILQTGSPCEPWPTLGIGQAVRVEQGALAGLEGVVESHKNGYRLVISVNLLQRAVAVEIDAECLTPISNGVRPGSEAYSEKGLKGYHLKSL